MAYSEKIIEEVLAAPKTLGNRLGRWAIHLDFPVTKIAQCTNVTRQTVYNWFGGGDVFVAYQSRVETLITIFETSANADVAWSKACQAFKLHN